MTTPPLSAIIRHARPQFRETLRHVVPTAQSALPNGYRVASQAGPGETCTVGVWIDAGSRLETTENNGVAHFLEHMNFKGTGRRSRRDIEYGMEKMGAHLNAYTSREQTCYFVKCFKKDTAEAVDILADILLNSRRSEEDVEQERGTIMQEKEDVEAQIEEVMTDHLHEAAFESTGLGLTILGPEENIRSKITKKSIDEFVSTHYTGSRMCLVGSGAVDHDELCDLASKHFGSLPAGTPRKQEYTRFMAGSKMECNDYLPLTHMACAFWTPGANHPDAVNFRLLEQLLGTYSRDKGEAAYSCFTRAIVAEYYSPIVGSFSIRRDVIPNPIHTLKGFWTPYSDVGLFGYYTIIEPGHNGDDANINPVVHFGMRELVRLCHMMSDEEFERAKNQLKVQTMLQLDGTVNIADDIGRQVLLHGSRKPLDQVLAEIDSVSKDSLIRCAHEYIYDKDPVVAAIGHSLNVPEYLDWRSQTLSYRY